MSRDNLVPAASRRTLLRGALALAPLLALPAGLLGPAFPAAAELSDLDMTDLVRIEQYMDGIITMQARFQQIEGDGRLSFGTIYLRKPGRLRVEYDPPVPILLVADGGLLSYQDTELDQLQQMPLEHSTAWFLVRHPIDLTDGITVSQIDRSPGGLQIHLHQTETPEAGSVSLIFNDNPLQLTQWTVIDGDNNRVRVALNDLRIGVDIPNAKFATPRPCSRSDHCEGGVGRKGRQKD